MKKALITAALTALIVTSCGKKGCTDAFADNPTPGAKRDDGSCTYTGKLTFWYSQDEYLADILPGGHDTLEYFIEDVSFGTFPADNSWTDATAPDCASIGVFQISTLDMGEQALKLHNWDVRDAEDGTVLYTGSDVFTGGQCFVIELQ